MESRKLLVNTGRIIDFLQELYSNIVKQTAILPAQAKLTSKYT